ncbi:beta-lactamase [[Clostridium] sordellii]|uniref:ComEC/Rec2 family competence protein n=1 Tax=Paraclostridium sordellii TaxID=1505 RepID=UPI0005E3D32D|nr:ComEC/Rec2 family competence protein [Paeniclostridium sordellii]CEQ19933.1 beta-lactamase [[Clostridium] sordellii] [Paeniclostridium sordellii]
MNISRNIKKIITSFIATFVIVSMAGCTSNDSKEVKSNTQVKSYNQESETKNTDSKEAQLHFIDTGNSDAILIKQGDKAALIDGGDNDDEGTVVKYLKNQGVNELEYVFATHPHADHIGGLDAVINAIPVKNVYVSNGDANTKTYTDFIKSIANRGLHPSVPLLNSEFELGTSKFKVLSVANTDDPNNNSIVLEYINGNDKVLLMGDAEADIEAKINTEDVDLLKVGHHGSHSSSTKTFIDKVNPEYAVIMAGKDNKYGHPHKETMDTLKSRNIEVHRSDECGDIVFTSTGNGLKVNCNKGSYKSGNEKGYNQGNTNDSSLKNSQNKINSNKNAQSNQVVSSNKEGIVYWTPKGKSYHTTKNCSALSKSKNILSGTIQESGKSDPCDRCN